MISVNTINEMKILQVVGIYKRAFRVKNRNIKDNTETSIYGV